MEPHSPMHVCDVFGNRGVQQSRQSFRSATPRLQPRLTGLGGFAGFFWNKLQVANAAWFLV